MTARACLVDVYETIVHSDLRAHATDLPRLAGVDPDAWNEAFTPLAADIGSGALALDEAMAELLRSCGVEPSRSLVDELVALDRVLLIAGASVFDDVVPFLERLRSSGVATALVSNCAANTGPLLEALGLTTLVDAVVLSCDVGAAKPSPVIFRHALDRLGVDAADAVLVDDKLDYCVGAMALGMRAVMVSRGAPPRPLDAVPPPGLRLVAGLGDLAV